MSEALGLAKSAKYGECFESRLHEDVTYAFLALYRAVTLCVYRIYRVHCMLVFVKSLGRLHQQALPLEVLSPPRCSIGVVILAVCIAEAGLVIDPVEALRHTTKGSLILI